MDITFDKLYQICLEQHQIVLNLVENVIIEGRPVTALVDSGNGAYNVVHGTDLVPNRKNLVSFKLFGDKIVTKRVLRKITIHTGSGNKEERYVVPLDIKIKGELHRDIPFSIADRSENEHPVLIGADFVDELNALIDVSSDEGSGLS